MSNHTAESLLAAVGINQTDSNYFDTAIRCSVCKETTDGPAGRVSRCYWHIGHSEGGEESVALEPSYTYTGPALGTPELDAVLLVEGQRALREAYMQSTHNLFAVLGALPDRELHNAAATLLVSNQPGHALAAAIAEVKG